MSEEREGLIFDQVSVRCLTVYCPACEEGEIVPFLRAKEESQPTMGELNSYRDADAVRQEWAETHKTACEARTRALAVV